MPEQVLQGKQDSQGNVGARPGEAGRGGWLFGDDAASTRLPQGAAALAGIAAPLRPLTRRPPGPALALSAACVALRSRKETRMFAAFEDAWTKRLFDFPGAVIDMLRGLMPPEVVDACDFREMEQLSTCRRRSEPKLRRRRLARPFPPRRSRGVALPASGAGVPVHGGQRHGVGMRMSGSCTGSSAGAASCRRATGCRRCCRSTPANGPGLRRRNCWWCRREAFWKRAAALFSD